MDNNNCNTDNKENLGHGIKGSVNADARNLKNDTNQTNNCTSNGKKSCKQ